MSDPTAADLWREADELERRGRLSPIVPGSVGQPVLNKSLRKAQELREQARRLEHRPIGRGDTAVSARMAEAANLEALADLLDSMKDSCAPAGRHAQRLRRHVALVTRVVRTPPRPCANPACSELLPPVYISQAVGRTRKFCSDDCRALAHRTLYPKPSTAQSGPRPCEFCGWSFDAPNASKRFCSTECAYASRGAYRRFSGFTVISWDECEDCGEPWLNLYSQRTRCQPCFESNRRARVALRRAAHRGSDGSRIDPLDIFERDGWVCQLCADPVLPFVRWPHPRSASVDHIVPIIEVA